MAGVVHIPWYATILRQESFVDKVCEIAPLVLRHGATKYSVHRSRDDRYKILQMAWFESKIDWYRYWDGPEMIEFRRRNMGHYQIPVTYVWHDELTVGALASAADPPVEPSAAA
ncbi:MAG TPA: hypothetical protein VNR66_13660 [Solirubrobacteraceae bacterium]|nr:hypothetical protein [Solirubrobacteraceae bacterium]